VAAQEERPVQANAAAEKKSITASNIAPTPAPALETQILPTKQRQNVVAAAVGEAGVCAGKKRKSADVQSLQQQQTQETHEPQQSQ